MSKIANPKTEVPNGINLNEKDYMDELLSCLKCMEKDFAVVKTEASNEILYDKYREISDSISSLQRTTYELMFKKGWYELEEAEINKINEKLSMLSQELSDLNQSA